MPRFHLQIFDVSPLLKRVGLEMNRPVNENGIDKRNESGRDNRHFQGGQSIFIFSHNITNYLGQARLDINFVWMPIYFISILEYPFYYHVQ